MKASDKILAGAYEFNHNHEVWPEVVFLGDSEYMEIVEDHAQLVINEPLGKKKFIYGIEIRKANMDSHISYAWAEGA